MMTSRVFWATMAAFLLASTAAYAENPGPGAAKPKNGDKADPAAKTVITGTAKPNSGDELDVIAKPAKPAQPAGVNRPAVTSALPIAYNRTNNAIIVRMPLTKLPP